MLFSDVLYMLVRYAKWSYVLEVPDIDFIRPCGVVFALFYCRLNLCCGECYVGCLQFECFLSMCLFVLCVLCLTVLLNCLLSVWVR